LYKISFLPFASLTLDLSETLREERRERERETERETERDIYTLWQYFVWLPRQSVIRSEQLRLRKGKNLDYLRRTVSPGRDTKD
jgi:hypothetical protein